jgi:hypothetical protein
VQLIRASGSSTPPCKDVALTLEGDHMRALATRADVRTHRRNDLDIPESWQ